MAVPVRFLIFLLGFVLLSPAAFSQKSFRRFALGGGAGFTSNASDFETSKTQSMLWGSADFYFTRYIHASVEVQKGILEGKESDGYMFHNDYKALLLLGKVHLGAFLEPPGIDFRSSHPTVLNSFINGLYLGSGGGIISNNQSGLSRKRRISDESYIVQYDYKDAFIPVTIGSEWNVDRNARLLVCLGASMNFLLGDYLDGYMIDKSGNDRYCTLHIGIKYQFGRLTYY